ncbi:MAG: hypothetical protein WBF71_08085, partial [Microthrixaceae bacterium]
MAKYDPKRPRPTVGDDQAAPVEALIEAVSAAPDAVEERSEATAVVTATPTESASSTPSSSAPEPAALTSSDSDEARVEESTILPADPVGPGPETGELADP